MESQTKD